MGDVELEEISNCVRGAMEDNSEKVRGIVRGLLVAEERL